MSNESTISTDCMLSTFDNPFNPFEQFNDWLNFDVEKGYYSCSKLARISNVTDEMTEKEEQEEIERAIDEIIKYDFMNVFRKVRRNEKVQVF